MAVPFQVYRELPNFGRLELAFLDRAPNSRRLFQHNSFTFSWIEDAEEGKRKDSIHEIRRVEAKVYRELCKSERPFVHIVLSTGCFGVLCLFGKGKACLSRGGGRALCPTRTHQGNVVCAQRA